MRVQVLLSTYNGERWLAEQLDSVRAQTHPDLVVTARDDGSTDGTREILAACARRDRRVQWSAGKNLGAARSFSALGEVLYDPSPSVHYRQHEDNTIGVGCRRQSRWWRRVRKAWSADYVASYCRQAGELRRLHADRLPEDVRNELDAFLAPGAAARLRYALAGGAHRQHAAETVGVPTLHALGQRTHSTA